MKHNSTDIFHNFLLLLIVLVIGSCLNETIPVSKKTESEVLPNNWKLPEPPKELENKVLAAFPGAMIGVQLSDTILNYLNNKYHIPKEKMLLGAATCVDDIIFTKNFHSHPEIKGPFHLGGLAGLPFTGVSGLEAFAHHIPEGGAMILVVEPHIGYSVEKGWGTILRHQQHEVSTCCGALMGTLAKLRLGKLKDTISEEDYQGGKIAQLALKNKKLILSAKEPIIELTKLTAIEAERQIRSHVLEIEMQHIQYIVILTGVMINLDYMYCDYQVINHLLVYDVRKKQFVEEMKDPFR